MTGKHARRASVLRCSGRVIRTSGRYRSEENLRYGEPLDNVHGCMAAGAGPADGVIWQRGVDCRCPKNAAKFCTARM